MVPGVLEADGGHTWDWLAAVHQVDATIVGAERSRIHVHCRREAPAVKAQVPDGAWTLVLHLHYEDGVTIVPVFMVSTWMLDVSHRSPFAPDHVFVIWSLLTT